MDKLPKGVLHIIFRILRHSENFETGGANMRHGQINTDPGTGEDFDHLHHLLHQDFGGFRGEITDLSRA